MHSTLTPSVDIGVCSDRHVRRRSSAHVASESWGLHGAYVRMTNTANSNTNKDDDDNNANTNSDSDDEFQITDCCGQTTNDSNNTP